MVSSMAETTIVPITMFVCENCTCQTRDMPFEISYSPVPRGSFVYISELMPGSFQVQRQLEKLFRHIESILRGYPVQVTPYCMYMQYIYCDSRPEAYFYI